MEEQTRAPEVPVPIEQRTELTVRERVRDVADKFKRGAAIALIALGGAGCAVDHSSVPEVPTQHDVAEFTIGDIAIGEEGDANGMFNTREAVDVPHNKYKKDGGIIDAIGGISNTVIGIRDPEAGDAPKSDDTFIREESSTTPGKITYETVPGGTKTIKTPHTVDVTTEKVLNGEEQGNTQYERDFNTDVKTFEQALTPAEKIAQETLSLIEQGYTVTSIRVTGRASGEDHTVSEPNANIGEPSANNVTLAEQRALQGAAALQSEMTERGVELSGVPFTLGGKEVEPTKEQMVQLSAAASELGISVAELTERFNTHVGDLSPEQTQLLMETLVNNRGVAYEIHASKTDKVEDGTFITTVIQLPPEVRAVVQPSIEKNGWLFRIELPGEVLVVLAAIGLGIAATRFGGGIVLGAPGIPAGAGRPPKPGGNGPRPNSPGSSPRPPSSTPNAPTPPPKPTKPKPTGGGRYTPPGTGSTPKEKVPKDEQPPQGLPRRRPEILTKGPGREDSSARGRLSKQPRPYNYGKDRSRAAGGTGRQGRSRGGDRRGKRG